MYFFLSHFTVNNSDLGLKLQGSLTLLALVSITTVLIMIFKILDLKLLCIHEILIKLGLKSLEADLLLFEIHMIGSSSVRCGAVMVFQQC